jgi:hypothetical protein
VQDDSDIRGSKCRSFADGWRKGQIDAFDQSRRKFDLSQGERPTRRLHFSGGEEEASMLRRAIGDNPRRLLHWQLIQLRKHRWTEIDPGVPAREGEDPLEAMKHWRDPGEKLKTIRRRWKSLLDDNPASG